MVAEAEDDTLQRRAPDVGDAVIEAQPDQRPAGMRIVERRLLPQHVGQEQHGAVGRQGSGQPVEMAVRRLARGRRDRCFARRHGADQPVEEAAARRHAAIGEIEAGHDVVVDEQPPVGDRLVGRQQDVPRAAELEHQVAVARGAADEGRGDVVGAAGDHRRAGPEPGMGGRRRADRADHRVAGADRRQQVGIDAGERDQLGIVAPLGNRHEAGLERPVMLDLDAAGQALRDEVGGADDLARRREGRRLVPAQPHQLRPDQLLAVAGARQGEEALLRHAAAKALELLDRPGVVLLDAAAKRPPGGVEQDHCRQHAGDPDPDDVGGGDAGAAQQRPADVADIAPPFLGVFLRPVGMVGMERRRPALDRQRVAGIVDHHADRRGRADVEAEQERHRVRR